ncbi:hypothetical protein ACM66B_005678 [Microbotryomycetes sp. NB124-2]
MSHDPTTTADSSKRDKVQPARDPSSTYSKSLSSFVRLVFAVSIVLKLHWTGPIWVPRCQLVMYPTSEHGDVTYGLRVVISTGNPSNISSSQWQLELGKVNDDSLRSRMQSSYVGLADNWFYFKIQSPEQSHLLLASLWKADMITRQDAEAVLGKGPAKATSAAPFIHRLPSLSTLAAAYYAGATVGTRVVLGRLTVDSKLAPVVVGAATVGGASVLFSRSSMGGVANVTSSLSLSSLGLSSSSTLRLSDGDVPVPLEHVRILSPQDADFTTAYFGQNSDGGRSRPGVALGDDWFEQAVQMFESAQK